MWPFIQEDIPNLKGKGLYTGETILHMAIVNGDTQFLRFLLEKGANVSAKAIGDFFMPVGRRRGHKPRKSFWGSCIEKLMFALNIHHVDDTVDDPDEESAFEDCPDKYFGQLPLSFAACVGRHMCMYVRVYVRICVCMYVCMILTRSLRLKIVRISTLGSCRCRLPRV